MSIHFLSVVGTFFDLWEKRLMYKKRIYLDTSVISYLYENDSPEKMRITLNLWDLFKRELYDIYISRQM